MHDGRDGKGKGPVRIGFPLSSAIRYVLTLIKGLLGLMACEKYRILFFDEAVAFGGSVVVLSQLFKTIDRQRFEPKLISSLDCKSLDQLFNADDLLCRFDPPLNYAHRARWMQKRPRWGWVWTKLWAYSYTLFSSALNIPAYIKLVWTIIRWRPQLIHINNGKEGFFISRLLNVPAILHVHGVPSARNPRSGRKVDPNVVVFICISKYIAEKVLESTVDPERIVHIPNPAPYFKRDEADRLKLRERYGFKSDDVVMMHAGRLIRWKGQLEFLRAFAIVAAQFESVKALVVGDDVEGFASAYPRELMCFVADNNLQGRVVFAGHVNNVQAHMAAVDIVIHSSIEPEPFGLVITEAMAAGAPVIAADEGAPPELIDPGVSGFLVSPNDTYGFSNAMIKLVKNPALRSAMGVAGLAIAREHFAVNKFACAVEAVYISVLKASKSNIIPADNE